MSAQLLRIDCKGMQCPAPILEVAKAARSVKGSARLEITADDGDFPVDIEAWCRSTGARLTSVERHGAVFVAKLSIGDVDESEARASSLRVLRAVETVDLDCTGMQCPAPILEVAKAARAVKGPAVLEVKADDGDFPVDIEAWCRSTGAKLMGIERSASGFVATLGLHGAGDEVAPTPPTAPPAAATPVRAPAPPTPSVGASSSFVGILDLRGQPQGMALLQVGQAVMSGGQAVIVADRSLEQALMAWASTIGAGVATTMRSDRMEAEIRLGAAPPQMVSMDVDLSPSAKPQPPAQEVPRKNKATYLVLRNDFESLMAAMMIANASAAQGMETELFFSFWGVNVLRGEGRRQLPGTELTKPVSFLKRMMKMMMPAGPEAQQMSKMHMGGVGLGMMKHFMTQQNVLSLRELMMQAVELDVTFTVCTMSMGIMGIQKEDLMDLPNIRFGGVTSFTSKARESATSMVF